MGIEFQKDNFSVRLEPKVRLNNELLIFDDGQKYTIPVEITADVSNLPDNIGSQVINLLLTNYKIS